MPLRFRRSFRLAPGVRLNVAKRGVSTSVGGRGAHVTVGHGKMRETVGIPGSGLSYTTTTRTRRRPKAAHASVFGAVFFGLLLMLAAHWLGWL